jgi:hypothetical protein
MKPTKSLHVVGLLWATFPNVLSLVVPGEKGLLRRQGSIYCEKPSGPGPDTRDIKVTNVTAATNETAVDPERLTYDGVRDPAP